MFSDSIISDIPEQSPAENKNDEKKPKSGKPTNPAVKKLKNRGSIFVISGPSGAGKDTIIDAVIRELPNIKRSVAATTRHPRPSEIHGEDYFFLSSAEFEELVKSDGFLE